MPMMSGAALKVFDPPMCCSTGVCGPFAVEAAKPSGGCCTPGSGCC
jgi:hypothetical protein